MERHSSRERDGAPVVAVHLPRGTNDEPLVLALRPTRSTVLLTPDSTSPASIAATAASIARANGTFVLDGVTSGRERVPLPEQESRIRRILPDAEVLATDPEAILKFLWFYRDRHDPMALGHSSERTLLDESFENRHPPRIRKGSGRGRRRRAMEDVNRLLLTMGFALGVTPPLPDLHQGATVPGRRRQCGVIDACLALYSGVLFRWGAPLALKKEDPGGVPRVILADRWLRRRLGLPPRAVTGA